MKTLPSVQTRPVLRLRYTVSEWILEAIGVAGIVAAFALIVANWAQLPERIPIHFTVDGEANGWGSRATLVMVPCVMTFVYAGLTALVRVPHFFNYPWPITEENAERQYRSARMLMFVIKAIIAAIAAYATWEIVTNAHSSTHEFNVVYIAALVGALLIAIGVYLFIAARRR